MLAYRTRDGKCQQEIADRVIELLRGYMQTLRVGDPALPETDVGPVIDAEALAMLRAHVERLAPAARWLQRSPLEAALAARGHFFAPVAMEIESLELLQREVFGPVLHVVRYASQDLDRVVDAVNGLGYGLTLGVQTRIDSTARQIASRARVGNVYVNRNMIGDVVGVQPEEEHVDVTVVIEQRAERQVLRGEALELPRPLEAGHRERDVDGQDQLEVNGRLCRRSARGHHHQNQDEERTQGLDHDIQS